MYLRALSELLEVFSGRDHRFLPGRTSFNEILDDWLLTEKPCIKQSTYAAYAQRADKHLRPALGELAMNQLTDARLRAYCQTLDGLAPSTQRGVICVLNLALTHARNRGWRLGSAVTPPRKPFMTRKAEVLSAEEQKLLEQFLLQKLDEKRMGLLLCMYTGLRLGEVCALQWDDISLSEQVLQVRRTVQRIRNDDPAQRTKTRVIFDAPKSSSSARSVPLTTELAALLARFQSPGGCYLLTSRADAFVDPRTYQDFFKNMLRKAGLRSCTFHTLRHPYVKPTTKKYDVRKGAKYLILQAFLLHLCLVEKKSM